MHKIFHLENLTGRDHMENLGIDGKVILGWMLRRWGRRVWTGFIWIGIETSGRLL
jgi:hypothetical protein